MTVYIDSLFLINSVTDFMLIILSMKILKKRIVLWRAAAAAVFGGIYATVIFFFNSHIIISVIVSVIMLIIAYKPSSLYDFFKMITAFYTSSFILSGIMMMLFYGNYGFVTNKIFYIRLPVSIFILSSFLFYMLINIISVVYKKIKKNILHISVLYNGDNIIVSALEDSGNLLREPVTNKPVMIAERDLFNIREKEGKFVVPFHSLGCESGIIYAVRPEKAEYMGEEIDVLIGLYDGKLSKNNEYNALIGSGICVNKKGDFLHECIKGVNFKGK